MTPAACSSRTRRPVDVGDLAEAVDRVAHRVDGAAEVAVAHRHGQDLAGATDGRALFDALGLAEHDDADLANVEVQCDAECAVGELQQLVGHRRRQPLHLGDAVTRGDDHAHLFAGGRSGGVLLDKPVEGVPNLIGTNGQFRHGMRPSLACYECSMSSVLTVRPACVGRRGGVRRRSLR
jgi:hypothetical protein